MRGEVWGFVKTFGRSNSRLHEYGKTRAEFTAVSRDVGIWWLLHKHLMNG